VLREMIPRIYVDEKDQKNLLSRVDRFAIHQIDKNYIVGFKQWMDVIQMNLKQIDSAA
jgi:hypothetical protein